jgi:hypothetical protein
VRRNLGTGNGGRLVTLVQLVVRLNVSGLGRIGWVRAVHPSLSGGKGGKGRGRRGSKRR